MERPKPWPVSMLGMDAPKDLYSNPEGHPFFPLKNFSLLTHRPLPFPSPLLLSRNYYNPAWTGLRRLKNVIILLEWTPDKGSLALISDSEHAAAATVSVRQEAAVERAHSLLAYHNQVDGGSGDSKLSRAGLANAVLAATGEAAGGELLDALFLKFGNTDSSGGVSSKRLKELLIQGSLRPEHRGRYWVAVSLAEAETLRRVLHLRKHDSLLGTGPKVGTAEIALHLSQPAAAALTAVSSKEASVSGGQAGRWAAALDASLGWRGESGTGATVHEAATAFGCFRFFDGDMHFTRPTLFRLVRAFQKATTHDRTKVPFQCLIEFPG